MQANPFIKYKVPATCTPREFLGLRRVPLRGQRRVGGLLCVRVRCALAPVLADGYAEEREEGKAERLEVGLTREFKPRPQRYPQYLRTRMHPSDMHRG